MAKKRKGQRTAGDYIKAIRDHHGIVSVVADALGVDRSAVYKMRDRHPTVATALEEARERMTDTVESKLLQRIDAGDTTAIIFYLKTQGKARGYVERQELDVTSGGEKLKALTTERERLADLTPAQLAALYRDNLS